MNGRSLLLLAFGVAMVVSLVGSFQDDLIGGRRMGVVKRSERPLTFWLVFALRALVAVGVFAAALLGGR